MRALLIRVMLFAAMIYACRRLFRRDVCCYAARCRHISPCRQHVSDIFAIFDDDDAAPCAAPRGADSASATMFCLRCSAHTPPAAICRHADFSLDFVTC